MKHLQVPAWSLFCGSWTLWTLELLRSEAKVATVIRLQPAVTLITALHAGP